MEDLSRIAGVGRDDIRILIKVGACDSIANGQTRPQMLWAIDAEAADRTPSAQLTARPPDRLTVPALPEYTDDRRRRMEYELLGFVVDHHPMALYEEQLARWRTIKSTEMAAHVGQTVLMAGMLTTAKPVSTLHDEPMEFATFDDGHGLIETVLFPEVYKARVHVLFDQGPFLLRGKVEEEFGSLTLTVLDVKRVDRLRRPSRPSPFRPVGEGTGEGERHRRAPLPRQGEGLGEGA